MSDPLARVRKAATRKRRAELEYRAALAEAVDAGVSCGEAGRAAGVSRQAVRQLLRAKVAEPSREDMEARLAELDGRWDALVDAMAATDRPPDSFVRRENAKRNGRRGKDARAGRPRRASVLEEARSFAESKLLRALRDNVEDPRVAPVVRELDEANALRDALEARFDRALGVAAEASHV